ncbi:hypothetical protein RJ639_035999 [Escallonia herrerae]|uniref:HMA domain-containing protein n=1 Tax=Escallonia herrerae TaxID=1293975 RepID=A0AA89B7W7_9ASTE|nr:hypothetical protein RJ639_035999 [Escallonia herrerae]
MESTLSATTSSSSLLTLSKNLTPGTSSFVSLLHRHFSTTRPSRCLQGQLALPRFRRTGFHRSAEFGLISLRGLVSAVPPVRHGPECVSSSAASFASGGGGFGGNRLGGDDGGGGGASDGGEVKANAVAGGTDDASAMSSDVIILDVGGMSCGGCAASVKRILESQPQVSTASVNLTTETAVVWPVSEAKVAPNWQKILGDELAKHLTSCGFKSNLRGEHLLYFGLNLDDCIVFEVNNGLLGGFLRPTNVSGYGKRIAINSGLGACFPADSGREKFFEAFERKMDEKRAQLKKSGRELAVSWALCAVCLLGHLSHFLGIKASWIHAIHSTGFHLSLSLFTLLGPGCQLIVDGLKSLFKGAPNMNTLVGLGALSSFAVSSLAALIPKLGWKAFFEEPVMLIAFVLLGRNLEQRAKIKATSDMTGLLDVLPSKACLLVNGDAEEISSTVEVPCRNLSVGDQIVILPGDRVPADGIVRAGRSTVDESSFTGEPLPVTKLPGAEVAAGSINLNGTLTIEVQRAGGETAMGDIVRLVEEAQSREAPVQRLADKVAGHFTYGVMSLSAATFMFWNFFGARILPATIQGSPLSLALQLSCSVLVVACPCALGLATPTAVLVGTSLGATRGLLLRGGNILEKFDSNCKWSKVDVLKFAAGVESSTIHPIGKAIVEAARALKCPSVKVADGTFTEEPGSGAVGTVEKTKVSVGTLEWVQRHGFDRNPFQEVEEHKNQSVVYVGVEGVLAGLIYVEDQIREDAAHVVESLSTRGINVYLLSGDKKSSAEYVASVVGIPKERVLSGVKPDEKGRFISRLQADKNIVAMVGDGINDAAALASSHVGVAMGGGVGAASEVSSIVLMGNRLSQLLDALELSRLTMKTVKQNLWWAFGYNIVGIPIAAGTLLPVNGIMLTPSIAGGLMGLSSIGVMTNSLLLRFRFMSKQKQSSITSSSKKKTPLMSSCPVAQEDIEAAK